MRAWVVALLVVPAFAGCSDGGNFVSDLFTSDDEQALAGLCGHAYRSEWEQQAILFLSFGEEMNERIDLDDMEVSASKFEDGEKRGKRYHGEVSAGADGCVSYPLDGEGVYHFWAFGVVPGKQDCYVSGDNGGRFDAEFSVAKAAIVIEEFC